MIELMLGYIIKPPLVGEHAFPLTGFVRMSAHGTHFVRKKINKNDVILYLTISKLLEFTCTNKNSNFVKATDTPDYIVE